MNIEDHINKEIPPDLMREMEILNRIRYPLKDTSTSAISTSAQESDKGRISTDESDKEVDRLIDNVNMMENKVNKLEDLMNQHLKDMDISPTSDRVSEAAKRLGSDTGNITKDIYDKANAIMDHLPILTTGNDPVLSALTGNTKVDGPYLKCNEITSNISEQFNTSPADYSVENPLEDMSEKQKDAHDERMAEMVKRLVLKLWWNTLWSKFVVMNTIINPIRVIVAHPTDGIISVFQNGIKGMFRKESKDWRRKNGPFNRLLNKLACLLINKFPRSVYKEYQPDQEIVNSLNCPEPEECNSSSGGSHVKPPEDKQMMAMSMAMEDECFSEDELLESTSSDQPEGLGISPDCAKAATIVLDAVIADALTAKES